MPTLRIASLLLAAALTSACGDTCGDRVVGETEKCDSAPDAPCETACGTRGVVRCDPATCRLGACQPPAELCNAGDDDCDGRVDEGFECTAGATRECTTACGTSGRQACGAGCALAACEPPPELCDNGVDDDCDGVIDRVGVLSELVVTDAARGRTAMVLAGGEHVLAWAEQDESSRRVRTRRVSAGGALLEAITAVESGTGREIALAEAGGSIVLAYGDPGATNIFTTRVDPTPGAPRLRRFDPSAGMARDPVLAPMQGGIGLAFTAIEHGLTSVWVAIGDRQGRRISPSGQHVNGISLAPGGAELAVAWSDDRHGPIGQEGQEIVGNSEIFFRRISEQGEPVGDEVRVTETEGFSDAAALVWNGRGYGLAWLETAGGRSAIHFRTLDVTGSSYGRDRVVSSGNIGGPSLAWSGTEWGVAWIAVTPEGGQVDFARLGDGGARIDRVTRLTTTPIGRFGAQIAWNGASWSVVWSESNGPPSEGLPPSATVHLARVGCE